MGTTEDIDDGSPLDMPFKAAAPALGDPAGP